jgi:hypothetical protein
MKQLSLLILLCLGCIESKAQYGQHQPFRDYYTSLGVGGERVLQRLYLGVGKHIVSGGFSVQYTANDSLGNSFTMGAEQKLSASNSLVLHVGTFFPIALMGDNSAIALNMELMFSYAEFGYDSVVIHPELVYKKRVPYIIAGVPISVDFKTGCDISMSKKRRTMFALGAGVVPCLSTPAAANRVTQSSPPVALVPFVKLEAGMFAGLAFKVRATAYLKGGIDVSRTEKNLYFIPDELKVNVQSGYGYHFSVIIMPFSYGWRGENW